MANIEITYKLRWLGIEVEFLEIWRNKSESGVNVKFHEMMIGGHG